MSGSISGNTSPLHANMEAAGTAVAIAALFNTVVDDIVSLRIAKNFDRDSETCRLKLAHTKCRLTRWGASMGLPPDADMVADEAFFSPQSDRKLATQTLTNLKKLLNDANKKARKLGIGKRLVTSVQTRIC